MANVKFTDLPAAVSVIGTEITAIVQSATSKSATLQQIANLAPAPAWSSITGTPTTLAGYGITDAATATQGAKADTAVQPGSLATIAFTGNISALLGFPGGTTTFWRADGTFAAPPVVSVAGKTGTVSLVVGDVSGAAPTASPTFTGTPAAPTPLTSDNSTTLATTAYVQAQGYVTSATAPVTSVASKTGAVTLAVADVSGAAPTASPTFTGTPISTTPATADNSTKIATTAYVQAQGYVTATSAPVTSVASKTGAVSLVVGDVSGAAPTASPTLTGTVTIPTPTAGDNSTKAASTAFVATSFAPLASPTFTGTVTIPTPTAGDNSTKAASTAFVATSFAPLASPTLTGTPAAPTAAFGTSTTQLATTAFVQAAVAQINVTSKSADYTLVLADAGGGFLHPSSDAATRTWTIPANGSVAYPVGTVIKFWNLSANSVTIAITTDTMYLGGTGTTGSRTLAQYGNATAEKLDSTHWMITGVGLT